MKYIINIIILFLLLFPAINVASASQELPFSRMMIVAEWGGQFSSKEKIDEVMNNVSYMNADAIMMHIGSEYYEAVRDPVNKGNCTVTGKAAGKCWDTRASWNMLEYAIDKAHSKNIQLHVTIAVNSVGLPTRAEWKMWGGKYNVVKIDGTKDSVRLEIANPIVSNYEIGLISFIANQYPTLDGIHIEEPFYTTQSYSPEIVARVKAKYNGYDISGKSDFSKVECRGSSLKGLDQTLCPTFSKIYDVEHDVFNEFFRTIRAYVNANKSNPNLLLSANAFNGYRPLHGFDPVYMSDNHLLDWYAAQTGDTTLIEFKSNINYLIAQVNDIPTLPVSFITKSSIYPNTNPAFFEQVKYTCEYGGYAEIVFNYQWRNNVIDGTKINAYNGLHNLPPSSLCGQSTIVSAPTFSAPSGTYPISKNIAISTSTTGATIHYTIDGTTPTETSPIYSTPIVISSNTTLKARAWKTGLTPSAIKIATYNIGMPVLTSIIVSPSTASIAVGSNREFDADPTDQFGASMTPLLTWTSSDISVGTITSSGIFTALAEGTTTITASNGSVTGTATVVITTSQLSTNYINNAGFESGETSWNFFTNGDGTFSAAPPGYEGNNSAVLALSSAGTNIQLYQTGIILEPNTSYRLRFAAFSTTGNDVTVNLIKHDSPYTNYGASFTVDLDMNWQTFEKEFNTRSLTGIVNDGRLMFWFSPFEEAGDIYFIDDIRLEKVVPPVITTHPADQTVEAGQTAEFRVIATGSAPLSYQWQKNDVNISGAVGPMYTTPATILSDSGSTYRVLVTNSEGSTTSNAATLTLKPTDSINLIMNPGFESETTSWSFYTSGKGAFTTAQSGFEGNNAAKIAVGSAGSNIQFYQTEVILEPDTRYRLSFAAYSTTGNDVTVRLFKHVSPYTAYMPDFTVNLETTWQTFTTEFISGGFSSPVNEGRLMFWLAPFAIAGDTYYIDNVILERV